MRIVSIRTRLILLIALIAAGLLGGIIFMVYRSLQASIREKVVADFEKTRDFLHRQELLIYDRLVESCWLIGQNPAFKANVALRHPPSVAEAVDELAGFTKTDLILVTDRQGLVLAWLDQPEMTGQDVSAYPGLAEVLGGTPPEALRETPLLWALDDRLYRVVSVPVEVDGLQLGTLSLGTRFTDYEASDIRGETGFDIHILLDSLLIGSTLGTGDAQGRTAVQTLVRSRATELAAALGQENSTEVFTADFGGRGKYMYASSLGDGAAGYFLAVTDKERELALLNSLLRRILAFGLAGLGAGILLAFWLGNRFTRPVLEMVGAMDRVREGDLEQRLAVRSRDEYGRLAEAFNEMIRAFRERLQLSRYVGAHTLRMVSAEGVADPGRGQRLDMAVFFSDIRGFTAFSEGREPEAVITMLNAWLGFQTAVILEAGGVVDKFVGDEILALFQGEDAVARAWRCASAIQQRAPGLAQERGERLAVGIGIHYGSVVMGDVGAGDRLDYTVIGSTVNLAARLCSAARAGEVVLTGEAAALLDTLPDPCTEESLALKGIAAPVPVRRCRFAST